MPSAVDPRPSPISDNAIPAVPPDLSAKLPRLTPRRRTKKDTGPAIPAPETPALPPPPSLDSIVFKHPSRRILSPHDHELFLASPTNTLITSFIFSLADSVQDTPISAVAEQPPHPTVTSVISLLDYIETVLDAHPAAHNNGSRFGNPVFRTFISALSNSLARQLTNHFPALPSGAIDELSTYLIASLGSPARIDYGSGHELHFAIFLLCLNRLSLLPPSTFPTLALLAFPRYLTLMRRIQSTYYLEPAGSHGVWGLDDFHFLPFLLGATQLTHHPVLRPLSIHSAQLIDDYAADYLYLDAVRHVNATKTVQGLRWHSPLLDDISGVRAGWARIAGGLRKMFLADVTGKLVVMQHFLFGGLVPAVEGMSEEEETQQHEGDAHEGHEHRPDSWDDCCGIKVPSSVGAAEELRRKGGEAALRRLPFD